MKALSDCGGGLGRPRKTASLLALVLAALAVSSSWADWHVRQVASINRGMYWDIAYILPYEAPSDSYPQLIFHGGIPYTNAGLYFYQCVPFNRYRLVKIDTGNGGWGLIPGNMLPYATGDVDGDSCMDLVAENCDGYHSIFYLLATLYETSASGRCPDSLVWHARYDSLVAEGADQQYITDLDQDGKKEIFLWHDYNATIKIYENMGNDSMQLVTTTPCGDGYSFAFGDFDQDGGMEFATAPISGTSTVKIFKCTGDDQYVLWDTAHARTINGHYVFSASNIDGSHHAEFFASYFYPASQMTYLYMYEPTQGTRGYQPFPVDSAGVSSSDKWAHSVCGDIDGDGIDEIIWSTGTHIRAYKCMGPHQFQLIWYWWNEGSNSCNLNLHDMNGNGYNEILMSGGGRTYIFEIEAIRVLYPNTRLTFHPGDTCRIRWQTYNPPRCDSISLFLRKDTTWQLDTIVHGLPPSETAYAWLVPDIRSDSCRVVAIAYGPGWQYNESDTCFRIAPVGVAEASVPPIRETRLLGVSPNPIRDQAQIRFQLAAPGRVTLRVSDVSGRAVATLADDILKPGRYSAVWNARDDNVKAVPAGIYFCRLEAGNERLTRKLVLTR